MLLPLAGFLFSATFISVMALLVLGIGKRPALNFRTFLAFTVGGFSGGIVYAFVYGRLFPALWDATIGMIGFFVGGPIFATIAGWLAAKAVAKKEPNQAGEPMAATGRGSS